MHAITATGLDIAKSVFQVHGVDAEGKVVFRRTPSRRCPFGASTTKLMVITTSPLNTLKWLSVRRLLSRNLGRTS